MHSSLLKFLVCPHCGKSLGLKVSSRTKGEILEGELRCSCGKRYPIVCGIPRFILSEDNAAEQKSFGLQWTRYKEVQDNTFLNFYSSKTIQDVFLKKTGFKPNELKRKLVLDAGCGFGRYSIAARRLGAEIIAVDVSNAVESCYENSKDVGGIHVVQADIFNLPFKMGLFDIIYSIGVIHHTQEAHAAFIRLSRHLKKKGQMYVEVYQKGPFIREIINSLLRSITTQLPHNLLFNLCYIPWLIANIPILGKIFGLFLPMSKIFIDNFDWYSPKYQSHHTVSEVFTWFKEAGFKERVLTNPSVLPSFLKNLAGGYGRVIGVRGSR